MKIIQYNATDKTTDLIEIQSADYMGDYVVSILFTDGNQKLVDFKPFLMKSLHPSISKYMSESLFKQFEIINGNLNWNDYDLIFPVYDLYEGKIN